MSTVDDIGAVALAAARGLYEVGSAEVEEGRGPLDDLAAAIAEHEGRSRSGS
ncbi:MULTISPECIES: hypothetical protein [Saccharothrix]|uniref:hypothetical protein n=1 Tax=Saccharothrix TaxID=2071 RepID=UPI00130113BB|nr:hypothetical protein [Saccharothrix sp. CB00851]